MYYNQQFGYVFFNQIHQFCIRQEQLNQIKLSLSKTNQKGLHMNDFIHMERCLFRSKCRKKQVTDC